MVILIGFNEDVNLGILGFTKSFEQIEKGYGARKSKVHVSPSSIHQTPPPQS